MLDQKWLPKGSEPSSKSFRKRSTKGNTICKSMEYVSGFREMEVIQGIQKIVGIPEKNDKI